MMVLRDETMVESFKPLRPVYCIPLIQKGPY
jgi:hypothetical protein